MCHLPLALVLVSCLLPGIDPWAPTSAQSCRHTFPLPPQMPRAGAQKDTPSQMLCAPPIPAPHFLYIHSLSQRREGSTSSGLGLLQQKPPKGAGQGLAWSTPPPPRTASSQAQAPPERPSPLSSGEGRAVCSHC